MINIKKLLLTGLIGFVGLLGFSNGAVIREVGVFGYSPRDNNMALAVNVKGQLLSEKGQVMRDMLFINDNHNNNNGRAFFFWTNSGYPYMYKCIGGSCYEGVPNSYKICDELLSTDDPEYFVTHALNNCSDWILFNDESQEYMNSFLSTIQNNDLYYMNTNYRTIDIAFSSSQLHKSIYFGYSTNQETGIPFVCRTCIITGSSLGFGSAIDFSSFNDSYLGQSPGVGVVNNVPVISGGSIEDYNYIESTTGDITQYYENDRWFSDELCYVGTTDLTGLYEDRLPYYQGSGYTIFDAFAILHNRNTFKISEVGTFLNTRMINYKSWFMGYNRDLSGEVIYNMVESGNGVVSLVYGPGLTNPFLGNKAVYYFIGSTEVDLAPEDNLAGQEIAFYCYNRLSFSFPGGSSIPGSDGYNITDDHDRVYDNWIATYKRNSMNYNNQFSGADVIVSQSWAGTPLDYFNIEGEEETEDLDFVGYFAKSFNKYKSVFQGIDISDLALGQLPSYIVAFLLAIIFFRFLSH